MNVCGAHHGATTVRIINTRGPMLDGETQVRIEQGSDNFVELSLWETLRGRLSIREALRTGHLVDTGEHHVITYPHAHANHHHPVATRIEAPKEAAAPAPPTSTSTERRGPRS